MKPKKRNTRTAGDTEKETSVPLMVEKPNGTFVIPLGDEASTSNGSTTKEADTAPPPLGFFQMYRFATTKDKILLTFAFLCTICTGAVAPLNTLVFADLMEAMIYYSLQGNPTIQVPEVDLGDAVATFAIRNCILGVIMLVCSYLSTVLANTAAQNQVFVMRKQFLQSCLNQDISYYDLNESGGFASRMTDDLLKLEDGIGEKTTICSHYWMSALGCYILAFVRGWQLALVCLASFPITLIAVGTAGLISSKLSRKESQAYGIAGAIAEEVLGGIRTVIAFGGQEKEVLRYKKNLTTARDINIRRNFFTGVSFGFLFFCIYSTYALSFWYGVGLILDDPINYPPAVMVSVFFGVMMGSMNFGISTPLIEVFGIAKGAGAKVFSVIDSVPQIDPLADRGLKPDRCEGNIAFKNVHFDYPSRPDVKILRGVNLEIKVGQTVAIVGGSGCGKSTCIQLIQRFYDPMDGSITLDNHDLRDLSVSWLRNNIGVVGQEPVLFNTTIEQNIRYGYEHATKEQIEMAARQANAHAFIKTLPMGYETIVGERGTQLSGGQKQRIAIARALVRNPKILLLDEATSALDNKSEAKVQAALDKAGEGRTTIIVAHRLSTIRNADIIVTLNEGRVVELGSHSQLMSLKGHYYNLVMAQIMPGDNALQRQESKGQKERRTSLTSVNSNDSDEDNVQAVAEEDTEDDSDIPILPLWKIARLNKPDWPYMAVACCCSFIMGAAMPVFSILFGEIFGAFSSGDPEEIRSTTNFYCIIFVVAGVVTGTSTFLSFYMFGIAGEKMTMRLRGDTFEAMLKQEMGWYDNKSNATGALCARLSGEASAVQGATGQRIGTIVQALSTLTLAVVLALYYEWRLGLVAMSLFPFTLLAVVMDRKISTSNTLGTAKAMEKSTKLAVEYIGSIRTVASLGCERLFLQQFIDELMPAIRKAKKNTHLRGLIYGFGRSIIFFSYSGTMYYGGYLIRTDNVSYEDVIKVSQAMIMATFSIADSLTFAPNLQKGIRSASNILYLINRIPKILDPVPPVVMEKDVAGQVNFKDVDFAYPTRPYLMVLQKLGLDISPGKTIALVGSSGCGKSTCIQLLERFYDPRSGEIQLDGTAINSVMLSDLRKNLGIVSQEPILFDRTIGENIAYGDNSRVPTQQEIIEAATKANIHKFISSLPLGYETRLGSKGTQLSGGQKQRVAIARALLRNPKVLLLDEATSALDTESEKVVQEALDEAKVGRTCITIAHRLSTIVDSDLICVFSDGCIAESGTHQELMELRGIYYRLQMLSKKYI